MSNVLDRIFVHIDKRGINMITYEKLFTILEEKGLNKAWLRKNGFNANNVDWLIKNKDVKISTIDKLCNLLDCQPQDILTFTKEKEKEE